MLETLNQLWQGPLERGLLASIVLIVALIVVRWLLRRIIRLRLAVSDALKAKWRVAVKNLIVVVGVIGLILIWAPQLRTFALSLTAVAVAIVIATKELILCISGSLVRVSSGNFTLGDLIEFAGHTGFVADQNLLVTELREYNPETQQVTGKQIVLPNSLFLTHPVRNLNALRPYGVRTVTIYLDSPEKPIDAIERAIAARLATAWQQTQQEAEFKQLIQGRGRDLTGFQPSVQVTTTNLAHVALAVTFLCRGEQRAELEQDIHQIVFEQIQSQANAAAATSTG